MKKIQIILSLSILTLYSLTFSSCEKEDASPAFVGTWMDEGTDDSMGQEMAYKNTLTLTASTFEMIGQMDLGEGLEDMFGMKGSVSVSGNQMTITPTSLGMAMEGDMLWIGKDTEGWDELAEMMEMGDEMTATWAVEGNTLTITFDEDDAQTYTKQ